MTENTLCQGTCNQTEGSFVTATVKPDPLFFFRPETGEILECPVSSAAAVRREIATLDELLDQLLISESASQRTFEQLLEAQKGVDIPALTAAQQAADQALKKEVAAREALFKEFKDLPKFNDGGKGLMELLPLATHKGNPVFQTKRMTYVRSSKVKSHFRTYHDLSGDATKLKSFYKKGEDGRYKLDEKKLVEAFKTVKPKSELAKDEVTWWATGWAPEFVQAFNADHDPNKAKDSADKATPDDACAQFSGGATLLRFFAGVGRTTSVELSAKAIQDVLKGRGEVGAKISIAGRAGVELASGRISPKLYLPAKHGLHLVFPAGKNAKGGAQELNLGYMRLLIECELSASCGASAIAQGGLEFKLKADLTQGVKGAPAAKTAAAMRQPKASVGHLEAEAAVSGELSAFAGAEALASVGGALQWQQAELLEFKNFAKIDAKGAAQAGVGGTAMFDIRYEQGKFRIRMKLGACVGLGLKGEVNAEVGVIEIVEFDLWFKHQVTNALDQNLQYFEAKAWQAFVHMKALAIAEGRRLSDYVGKTAKDLAEAWKMLATNVTIETLRRIRASRDYVLTSVAEVKALLMGLLEKLKRVAKELRQDIEDTARWLLSAAQTTQEADNIYARIGIELGASVSPDVGAQRVAALMGGTDQLDAIVAELKTAPTPGYRLAFCTEPAYRFALGSGEHIAWKRTPFGQSNNQLA